MSQRFQWDRRKATANLRNHGVSFDQGVAAFNDVCSVEIVDEREDYGEERVNLVGLCEFGLLHVTFVERGDQIRIISVRKAERHEHDHYFRENGT